MTIQKFDPYLNVDPGTVSPDSSIGRGCSSPTTARRRTLDSGPLRAVHRREPDRELFSVTSGKVYWSVLNRERSGDYLGGTIQVIPHITNEIEERIYRVGQVGSTPTW